MDLYTVFIYIGAYSIATFVASSLIKETYVKMWESYGEFEKRKDIFSGIVGNIERIMYVTVMAQGSFEVVAVWLGVKTATQWKRWTDENLKAQGAYNVFLIGNGLSVLFSIVGASLVTSYRLKLDKNYYAGQYLFLIISIIVLLLIFWYWLQRKIKSYCDSDDAFWKKEIKIDMKKENVIKLKDQPKKSEKLNGAEYLYYEYFVPGKCYKQTIKIEKDAVVEINIQHEKNKTRKFR